MVEHTYPLNLSVSYKRAHSASLAAWQAYLAKHSEGLPAYGSPAFWSYVGITTVEASSELPTKGSVAPLEVLVKAFRQAVLYGDTVGQQRLGEVIVARTHIANAQWVQKTLMAVTVPAGERSAVAADLYADLCEYLLRQWKNTDYTFWEEHFIHCLRFARKHVFEHFLRCEGAWQLEHPELGRAIPQSLLVSLDRATQEQLRELQMLHDKKAEAALQAVEGSQFALHLLHLHPRMRAIVWLKFWENCTEKKIAQVLSISERTVRSGLRTALEELRGMLINEEGVRDDTGA